MERLTINGHSNCLEEIFDFANDQVDEILCQVFQSVQPTSSTTPIRCRNDRRERNLLFHHTMPRCSLPTGKTTLLNDQPNYCRSFQNFNHLRYSDSIQYSFSLNRSCLTIIDQQRHQLISIQNFVNELIEHSIRTALLQIDFQQLTNENLDENDRQMSCLLFDCSPTINSVENYVDEFVQSIILQSIEDLTTNDENSTERYASSLSETILTDVLTRVEEIQQISQTLLTDDEKQRREIQRKSLGTKRVTSKDSSSSLFQQIRHRSTSALRSLIKTSSTPPDTLDSIVSSIAQQIHGDSREELRRIFIEQNPEF